MFLAKLRAKIAYFRSHHFVKNLAILQVGNTLGNVAQAIIGVIFARILEPEYYGIYALAFSLAGTLSIVLGLGAQDAVTTILSSAYAKKDAPLVREALAFLAKVTLLTGLLALACAFAAPFIANAIYHNYSIGIYAGIVILASVLSTTIYSFTLIILQVAGRIKSMSVLGLVDQLSRMLIALTLVLMGMRVLGIVLGHLGGAIIVATISAILWRRVRRDHPLIPSIGAVLSHVRRVSIRKYFGFSFWVAIDRNLANQYNTLPILLTGVYLVPGEVTYFKLAFGYLNLAMSFLGPIGTLLNVEFPKMRIGEHKRFARNFLRVSLYSFAISIGITATVLILAPIAFRILYGQKYLMSLPYVYGLFLYGSIMGLGIGLGSMVRTLNKAVFSVKVHLVALGVGVPVGLLLIKLWGIWGTVVLVTAWYVAVILVVFFYILRELRRHKEEFAVNIDYGAHNEIIP